MGHQFVMGRTIGEALRRAAKKSDRAYRHSFDMLGEAALTDEGALPDDWGQETAAGELRYYRPLTIAPPCLNCHGDPVDMDPRVVEVLQASYPDDQATGYEAGDLRGLIRVSVSEERVNRAIGGY